MFFRWLTQLSSELTCLQIKIRKTKVERMDCQTSRKNKHNFANAQGIQSNTFHSAFHIGNLR